MVHALNQPLTVLLGPVAKSEVNSLLTRLVAIRILQWSIDIRTHVRRYGSYRLVCFSSQSPNFSDTKSLMPDS